MFIQINCNTYRVIIIKVYLSSYIDHYIGKPLLLSFNYIMFTII